MFWVCAVISGLVIGLTDIFFVRKSSDLKKKISVILLDVVGVNIVSMFIFDLLFKMIGEESNLFPLNAHYSFFPILYAFAAFLLGFVWLLVSAVINGNLYFKQYDNSKKAVKVVSIVAIVFVALGTAAFTGTVWGMKNFNGVEPDQLIINLLSPTEGTSEEVMNSLWSGPVLHTVTVLFLFAVIINSKITLFFKAKDKERRIVTPLMNRFVCMLLSVVVLVGGAMYGITEFQLVELYDMFFTESTFIEDNFVDPREVKMQFPEKKRNLIHIYLESMENSYASTEIGGYMQENLIKPLTDLVAEGVSFSHLDKGFGGPITTTGCGWSVASMVNMSTGLPMKAPTEGNSYGSDNGFLPGAITIGDILKAQGYSCSLMFGASAKFGGLNFFYEDHGAFEILDYDAAKQKGWIPQDYKEWWGFEDDKLFDFAKKELTRLYESDAPFYFVMETADTHASAGYVGPNTPTPRDSQYANVIAYSASQVVHFVRWIQDQPFYADTTIVIIGDHVSMDEEFFKEFDPAYERTTFNLILNPAEGLLDIPDERKFNRWWFNGDMFPTMLASIGVKIDGDKLGLGTNLFSDKPTLMEENGEGSEGWKYVNDQFKYRSDYYVEHIFYPNTSFDNKNVTTY